MTQCQPVKQPEFKWIDHMTLRWRHNGRVVVTIVYSTVHSSADQRKISKLRITGLCAGNTPVAGEFPAQMASYAENVSIWWRHYEIITNWWYTPHPQTPLKAKQTTTLCIFCGYTINILRGCMSAKIFPKFRFIRWFDTPMNVYWMAKIPSKSRISVEWYPHYSAVLL